MIGIITAMNFELEEILGIVKNKEETVICGLPFFRGLIEDEDVVLVTCGEGKVNAARSAQIMICMYEVDCIINIGVAGSLTSDVKLGQVVIATSVVQHDYDMSLIGVPLGMIPTGKRSEVFPWGDRASVEIHCSEHMIEIMENAMKSIGVCYNKGIIATGDQFIADKSRKKYIRKHFKALACEMEGAAVGQVCRAADVDFIVIRTISDNADENAGTTYFQNQKKYSNERLIREVIHQNELLKRRSIS